MMALISVSNSGVHLLLPFAMRLYEQHARSLPRRHWNIAYAWLAFLACFTVAQASDFIALTKYLSWIGGQMRGSAIVMGVSLVASIAHLVTGWRRSAGAPRNRLALIVLALLAYALGIMVTWWSLTQTGNYFAAGRLGYVNALTMGLRVRRWPRLDRHRTKKGPDVAGTLPGRDKKRPGRCRPGLLKFWERMPEKAWSECLTGGYCASAKSANQVA
jgi:hypothetical protein